MALDRQDQRFLADAFGELAEAIRLIASHIEWGVKQMRTICPWCFQTSDWIDTTTTKCPECAEPTLPGIADPAKWVNRQTADGITAYRRAKALKDQERVRLRDS